MNADELRADMAADPPTEAMTGGGVVQVSGAVWEADTDVLGRLQREVHTWNNLHPDGGEDL